MSVPSLPSSRCPDLQARAPRAGDGARRPHDRLYLAPPALQGALVAIICRDTRGVELTDAQRLSHFPASPLVCLSWYRELDAGLVQTGADGSRWQPFHTSVTLSGSQSRPSASWVSGSGRGGMVCLTPDVAHALFGLDPASLQDRFLSAWELLDESWRPLLDALLAATDDAATLAALEQHLAPRWRACQGPVSTLMALRRIGRRWVEQLAFQAHEWRKTHSPRQVERRIKAYSGRSLRDWQALTRTEGAFFAARERHEAGQPFDWAALAQEQGFADQAHLSRTCRRITGFAPAEFSRRFIEDESFWLYRLWV